MNNRLLSMLPAVLVLSLLVASGTALADGPLDAVSAVQQPVAAVTQPVTQAVQTVTAATPVPPVAQATQPVAQATAATKPVTQAVNQTATTVTKPVTQAVQQTTTAVAKPVTQAVNQTATSVTKPVTQVVKQTTTAVTKPVTQTVKQTATAVTKSVTTATRPLTAAAKQVVAAPRRIRHPASTTAVAKPVKGQARRANAGARATTGPRTSRASARPARAHASPGAIDRSAGSPARVVTRTGGGRATRAHAGAGAVALAGAGDLVGVSLVPADRAAPAPGSTRQAEAAPRASVAGDSSSDGAPGGAIGLAALLGILGLGAARSGQMASGFLAVHGTGGLRSASQSLLTFVWSGRCDPLGGAGGSANATFADGAVRSSTAATEGGRGAVKGVLSPATPRAARGGNSLPPDLALIARPRGSGGLSALVWGLLVGASAVVGALLARITGGGRSTADGAS